MEKGWVKIFADGNSYKVSLYKSQLEANGIETIVLSKKDSMYQNFGNEELYVHQDNVIKALKILDIQ